MELESDRGARLDVPHPGQKQGGEKLLVTETLVYASADNLQQPFTRGVFQQADQWFHVRLQRDRTGGQPRLGGRNPRQAGQER